MLAQPRWNSALGVWEGNAALGTTAMPSPLWIFGYGSLCWKADFPSEEQFVGRVSGWKRLFAQRSTDHRGTPAAPGLVATVLTDEQLEVLKLRSPGTPYGALKGLGLDRGQRAPYGVQPRNLSVSLSLPHAQARLPRCAAVSATGWARPTSRAC